MKRELLKLAIGFVFFQLIALNAKADTLFVQAHRNVDLTWHESYDRYAYFPTEGKQYRKVYMLFTLGCASGGCSDWDYDVNNFLMHNTGMKDSSIQRLDTISESPLEVDTIWNVYDVLERYELGRFITPYGTYMNFRNPQYGVSGFDSSWEHTFIYDVTDYQSLMKDSVLIRSQYNGWSSGFSANIVFVMIEGVPQRTVLELRNVYDRGGSYQNTQQFETNVLPAKNFAIPALAEQAQIKVIITGHGANQAEGCGEFCNKWYEYEVDGTSQFRTQMWRDDCGKVAVAPQGGTWIFSRGNWCPGDKVYENRHEITPFLTGDSIELNMNIEPYTLNGSGGSSHNISSTVFFYGAHNFQLDAEIETIISPSTFSEHIPFNPSCGTVILVLKNNGPEELNYAKLEYGPEGGEMRVAEWEGSLGFEEKDTLYLPAPYWTGVDAAQTRFTARIYNQNHRYNDDEQAENDRYTTEVELVPRLEPFRLLFRTNGVPGENTVTITNASGDVVFELTDLQANTLYQEDINLPAGCYQLLITDEGGDGMHFWYYANVGYPQGMNGFVRLTKQGGGIYENFGGDFGSELRYNFIVGQMDIPEQKEQSFDSPFLVFPNPASDVLFVQVPEGGTEATFRIVNSLGQTVRSWENVPTDQSHWLELNLGEVQDGLYHIELTIGEEKYYSKLIIAKQ